MDQLKVYINLNIGMLVAILALGFLISGVFGTLSVAVMLLVCAVHIRTGIAIDESSKHGISELIASRGGGILIWLLPMSMLTVSRLTTNDYSVTAQSYPWPEDRSDWSLAIIPTLFFIMGLYEDITQRFVAWARLLLQLAICIAFLYIYRDLMPTELNLPILNWLLGIPVLAYIVLLVCMVGFVNAVNTCDGANGLLAGTAVLIGCVFVEVMPEPALWQILVKCWLLFLLVNVTTGRLFLGDSGAYLLGATFSVGFLWMYKTVDVSFVLILCLIFYPVLDFLLALARRLRHRRPLMEPDNYHFHNLLHNFISHFMKSETLANSTTGLLIAAVWPGAAVLMLYLGTPANSEAWLWVFGLSFMEFGIIRYALLHWSHKHSDFETRPQMEQEDAAT